MLFLLRMEEVSHSINLLFIWVLIIVHQEVLKEVVMRRLLKRTNRLYLHRHKALLCSSSCSLVLVASATTQQQSFSRFLKRALLRRSYRWHTYMKRPSSSSTSKRWLCPFLWRWGQSKWSCVVRLSFEAVFHCEAEVCDVMVCLWLEVWRRKTGHRKLVNFLLCLPSLFTKQRNQSCFYMLVKLNWKQATNFSLRVVLLPWAPC